MLNVGRFNTKYHAVKNMFFACKKHAEVTDEKYIAAEAVFSEMNYQKGRWNKMTFRLVANVRKEYFEKLDNIGKGTIESFEEFFVKKKEL